VISAQRAERSATLMSHLGQVQHLLRGWFAEDVHFYSITATPEHDTPERLQAFADAHGVRGKWRLLTGEPADVNNLRGILGWTEDAGRHHRLRPLRQRAAGAVGRVRGHRLAAGASPRDVSFVIPSAHPALSHGTRHR
jgi:hypothetical protein